MVLFAATPERARLKSKVQSFVSERHRIALHLSLRFQGIQCTACSFKLSFATRPGISCLLRAENKTTLRLPHKAAKTPQS